MNARLIYPLLIAASLLGSASTADEWHVGPRGVGPARIGMKLTQLKQALRGDVALFPDPQQDCDYMLVKSHPQLQLMMIKRKLARVDVVDPGVSTPEGIQVGDSAARVRKIYGRRIETMEHKYIDNGFYFTVFTKDKKYGTRFEIDENGKVGMFYAGDAQAIQYIEGCV